MKTILKFVLVPACLAILNCTPVSADVFLNELRVDQPGGDVDEYVEFFSDTGDSLDGLSYVILQDNGTIDGAISLTGFSISAGDVFLIGETDPLGNFAVTPDLIAPLAHENGENAAYLLVAGLTGSVGDDLDADDDGVFDASLPWTSIVAGIAMIDDDATILEGGSEDINYGPALGVPVIGPDGTFYPAHVFASMDGGAIDSIGAFDPVGGSDTPGALNFNPIPEPGSMMLIGFGMLGLVAQRRRK